MLRHDAVRRENFVEGVVDRRIEFRRAARQGVTRRQREGVCELAIMEQGPAAAQPANDRRAAARRVLVPLGIALEIAERERWLAPLVETKRSDAIVGGLLQQRLVDGHIPGPVGGRVDEQTAREHAGV